MRKQGWKRTREKGRRNYESISWSNDARSLKPVGDRLIAIFLLPKLPPKTRPQEPSGLTV
jgi:hypothetical protein